MKVQILDEARQDLVDGFRFYESQSENLGDYFLWRTKRLGFMPCWIADGIRIGSEYG